jgi:hypothetical protein
VPLQGTSRQQSGRLFFAARQIVLAARPSLAFTKDLLRRPLWGSDQGRRRRVEAFRLLGSSLGCSRRHVARPKRQWAQNGLCLASQTDVKAFRVRKARLRRVSVLLLVRLGLIIQATPRSR